ncbi:hypothetical protein F441_05569 [Phytophthora nicotianae CJ01A1]|uniref:Uncharacterized protein n=3 Tax=Phytophthora nicotianae TaxID=4792 RepID=W2ZP59_PHYNI|nr:hypothetical protein F444_05604 [Phytophthora nicotianae P1976]ETP20797.1 hypothetical protein F441_05569 [Phytophthora nicotianae CJ01A1]ETP48736.1 hypothetical protein F442_05604 [Phytophthora nicotianae P10297]
MVNELRVVQTERATRGDRDAQRAKYSSLQHIDIFQRKHERS